MIDRPPSINGTAVPYEAAVPELLRRLRQPEADARAACMALGLSKSREAFTALTEIAKHADWRYRCVVIEALAAHLLAPSAADQLVAALNDDLARYRVWACELARRFGDPAAKRQVRSLLRDPNGHVRKAAQRALSGE